MEIEALVDKNMPSNYLNVGHQAKLGLVYHPQSQEIVGNQTIPQYLLIHREQPNIFLCEFPIRVHREADLLNPSHNLLNVQPWQQICTFHEPT